MIELNVRLGSAAPSKSCITSETDIPKITGFIHIIMFLAYLLIVNLSIILYEMIIIMTDGMKNNA